MRNKVVLLGVATVIALGGLAAYSLAFADGQRSDCPGTVVCPLTGDEVCKDRCPLIDAERADCPGKVDCPITGQRVCVDECPLDSGTKAVRAATRTCCRMST